MGEDFELSLETVDDYCEEILHLSYVLNELHHYSKYDLEKVRLTYHVLLINLRDELIKITNQDWFKNETESDKMVCGEL